MSKQHGYCETGQELHCTYAVGLTIADAVPQTIVRCVVCGFDSTDTQEMETVPDRAIDLSTWED